MSKPIDPATVLTSFTLILTDTFLIEEGLQIFRLKISGRAKYAGIWKLMNNSMVAIEKNTCQEILTMILRVSKETMITGRTAQIQEIFLSKGILPHCPSYRVKPIIGIPANVGSSRGFLEKVMGDSTSSIREEAVEECGFGIIAALWYMTSESKYLPNMMAEFSSQMVDAHSLYAFPAQFVYSECCWTRENLLYNRHLLTYYFLKGNPEGFRERRHAGEFRKVLNCTDKTPLCSFLAEYGIRSLCAMSVANPEYKGAIVRACFVPLQHDPVVQFTINDSRDTDCDGFLAFREAYEFSQHHTLAHMLPQVQEEKTRLEEKMKEIDKLDDCCKKRFAGYFGVEPIPEKDIELCFKLGRHLRGIGGLKSKNDKGEIVDEQLAMAEIDIAFGITQEELNAFAKSTTPKQNGSKLAIAYNKYASANNLPQLHKKKGK